LSGIGFNPELPVVLCAIAATTLLILNHGNGFKPPSAFIVIISHDDEQETVQPMSHTVGTLLANWVLLSIKAMWLSRVDNSYQPGRFRINVYRAVPVEIIEGSQKTFTFSAATTPRSIAEQSGVTVYPEDNLSFVPVTNFVTQGTIGQEIVINPATPINVNLYGTPTVIRTHANTVGELLADNKIKLGQGDSVQPVASTALSSGVAVFVIHSGTQIQTSLRP